MMYLRANTCN